MLTDHPDFLQLPPDVRKRILDRAELRARLDVRAWVGAVLVVVVPGMFLAFVEIVDQQTLLITRGLKWFWPERWQLLGECLYIGVGSFTFAATILLNLWLHPRLIAAAAEKELRQLKKVVLTRVSEGQGGRPGGQSDRRGHWSGIAPSLIHHAIARRRW